MGRPRPPPDAPSAITSCEPPRTGTESHPWPPRAWAQPDASPAGCGAAPRCGAGCDVHKKYPLDWIVVTVMVMIPDSNRTSRVIGIGRPLGCRTSSSKIGAEAEDEASEMRHRGSLFGEGDGEFGSEAEKCVDQEIVVGSARRRSRTRARTLAISVWSILRAGAGSHAFPTAVVGR